MKIQTHNQQFCLHIAIQIIYKVVAIKMKKKTGEEQQLHISSFIKEPASLKLLILAGTNIKQTELSTIGKCTGLIKLDLSSNFLAQVPLKFNVFTQMKILYLHDNQLNNVDIKNAQLEYVSLFKNPITGYRRALIENNSSLLGIDYNIVTSKEKYGDNGKLPVYSEIKWPIVEISSNLEHEDDYLNLLKAEIFVIGNVYKRTCKIENIQKILMGVTEAKRYRNKKMLSTTGIQFLPKVIKAVQKWKQFTRLKAKLRLILTKKGKESLIYSRMELKRMERSPGVSEVLQTFLPDVRIKMKVRHVLQRQSRAFRASIPAKKELQANYLGFTEDRDYLKHPQKLYFKYSELDTLSKVCLYAKKLFFKEKDYDLCDQFNNLFKQTGKKFYIYRKNQYYPNQHSWLLNTIHQTKGFVLGQVDVDRKHLLYSKKGHKKIAVKNLKKVKNIDTIKEKMEITNKKINYLFDKYDKLIEYEVLNGKILKTVLKIIRYINAGNSDSIVSTETAYFQTEVVFHDQKDKNQKRTRIHVGLQFFTKRAISANIIQRAWRKYQTKKKSFNLIQTLRKRRAENLISKWARNLIFQHRMCSLKTRSYFSSSWRQKQVYFHLEIYMSMPEPTNFLRLTQKLQNKNDFYEILNKGTQVQIVQNNGRRWIKILYPSSKEASIALNSLQKFTYRYCNSFFLQFFTEKEINDTKMLIEYEKKVLKLFKINITSSISSQFEQNTKTTLEIDNNQPFFIWSQVNAMQHFTKFQKYERHSTSVNIFIYNKHKRPLKVSCEMFWVHFESLYQNKKKYYLRQKNSGVAKNTPGKSNAKINFLKQSQEGQLSLLDLENGLKSNMRKGKGNKNLFDFQTKLQKSLDKLNRRNSLGSKSNSINKSHRTRIISDHRLEHLSETLNIRGK